MARVFDVHAMRRGGALAALLVLSTLAQAQQQRPGSPWHPNALEQAQLPRYCAAQFNPEVKAQGVATPVDLCGVNMNHLCPGLVQVNRAANTRLDKSWRKYALGQARIEINYTLTRMPASCSIAPDARAAAARISVLQTLLR